MRDLAAQRVPVLCLAEPRPRVGAVGVDDAVGGRRRQKGMGQANVGGSRRRAIGGKIAAGQWGLVGPAQARKGYHVGREFVDCMLSDLGPAGITADTGTGSCWEVVVKVGYDWGGDETIKKKK